MNPTAVLPHKDPSPANWDASTLLMHLSAGDRDAAFVFCNRFGPRINRWVWRLLGGDPDHDEVVQQVYEALFSALGKLKKADALPAFVDSITIRCVRKEIRRRKYRRRLFSVPSDNEETDPADERRPLQAAHIRACYAILNDISTDERLVLTLRFFEGMTLEQIGTLLECSTRTAKRRLKKGKAAFKERAMKETVLLELLEELS